MDEQIRHAEHGIVRLLPERDRDRCAVLLDDNTVQGKRNRHPLILLDAAVVMRIKVRQSAVLIERILLHIKAARVDVCTEDIHAVFHRLCADMKEHNRLFHIDGVDLVPRAELRPLSDNVRQIAVARRLSSTYRLLHTLTLRLAVREEINIAACERIHRCAFLCRIARPNGLFLIVTHNGSFLPILPMPHGESLQTLSATPRG